MCKLFHKLILFIASKASLRLVVIFSMAPFAAAAYSQALSDSENLIFKITLPTDNSIELSTTDGADREENMALFESIELYQDSINNLQLTTNDPYNFELLEQYTSLGDAYKSLGQHETAISNYDNAIQISKIQGGLFNLEQLPLLEKIIQSYLALGDMENATIWHEYSHYLHLENYNAADPEMVEATFTLTQWYISNFFRSNFQSPSQNLQMVDDMISRQPRGTAGMVEDQDIMQQFLANPNQAQFENILNGNIRDINPRDIEHPLLLRVGSIYEELQRKIYAAEEPDIGSIVQTARRIAELSFVTKQEMDFERQHPNFNMNYTNTREQAYRNSQQRMDQSYDSGRNALQYIITLLKNIEARPRFLASALIELGDWHLAYGKIPAAEDSYKEAYAVMQDMGISIEAADQAFNGRVPYQIPRMATHMFTRRSAGISNSARLNYQGYFDVSFTIDGQGNADNISLLASSMNHDEDENEEDESWRIHNLIKSSLRLAKFRPYFNNQTLVSPGQINLRYYYAYAD
jgi:tetratricopeptide (TPR) repeat protein